MQPPYPSPRCWQSIVILPIILMALILHARGEPTTALSLTSPADGAVLIMPHPHFRWTGPSMTGDAVPECRIQIAKDKNFAAVVINDTIAVVNRFVPVDPLPAGTYWWRVALLFPGKPGIWTSGRTFTIKDPSNRFLIPVGSSTEKIAKMMAAAFAASPALVLFEKGSYTIDPKDKSFGLLPSKNLHDIIIDGNGSILTLKDGRTLFKFQNCHEIIIRNITITPEDRGHVVVQCVAVDSVNGTISLRIQPGFPPNLDRYLDPQNGSSQIDIFDPKQPGRVLGGCIGVTTVERAGGLWVVKPAHPNALKTFTPGCMAFCTAYAHPVFNLSHTQDMVFYRVDLIETMGACFGGEHNDNPCWLRCRITPRVGGIMGGHSTTFTGRIGAWFESSTIDFPPDDGPNVMNLRTFIIGQQSGTEVTVKRDWTMPEIEVGDQLDFVDPLTKRMVSATARTVSENGKEQWSVQLDRDIGPQSPGSNEKSNTLVYNWNAANDGLVMRKCRHTGGRGHGVCFKGRRALFEDNLFEHITGSAIWLGNWGDSYPLEGLRASEVLVRRNTIVDCGNASINSCSTYNLNDAIIIQNNTIEVSRGCGISIQGSNSVRITGNVLKPYRRNGNNPAKWNGICVRNSSDVVVRGNRYDTDPLMINQVKNEGGNKGLDSDTSR